MKQNHILLRIIISLFSLLSTDQILYAQGLSGPDQAVTGVATQFLFSDDYLIAQPRWSTSSASISMYSSGAQYYADITWQEPGSFLLEFLDGTSVLASIIVQVSEGCSLLPKPNAGLDLTGSATCGLKSIQLNASLPPEGMTGSWSIVSGSGGKFLDQAKPDTEFSGLMETDYILRWTIGNDGCYAYDEVKIRFNILPVQIPTITGDVRFGPGAFELKAFGATEGLQYRWLDDQEKVIGTQSILKTDIIQTNKPFFGSVKLEDSDGCQGSPWMIALRISPQPVIVASQSFLPNGGSIILSVTETFDTYSWKNGYGQTIGTTSSLSVNETGHYFVQVTKEGVTGLGQSAYFEVKAPFQVSAKNQSHTITPRESFKQADEFNSQQIVKKIEYVDGLGRPLQQVEAQWSPSGQDRVTPFVYDHRGKAPRQFMPIVPGGNSGQIRENLLDENNSFRSEWLSFFNDTSPYTDLTFEASPVARITEVLEPGQNWKSSNRKKTFRTEKNISGTGFNQELIIAWEINSQSGLPVRRATNSEWIQNGYFTSGALEVKSEKDEQGYESRTYYDQSGKILLKKFQAADPASLNDPTHWAQSYYIYDVLGRLRFVLQPELIKVLIQSNRNPTSSEISSMGLRYRYDQLGRVAMIQEPGRDSLYMVYDNRDRLVLTQDGNQRSSSPYRWTFYKYDRLNRMIASGLKDTVALLTQSVMQEVVNSFYRTKLWAQPFEDFIGYGLNNIHGYSNKSYPTVTTGVVSDPDRYLKLFYFDQYQFHTSWSNGLNFSPNEITGSRYHLSPASQTGKKIKVLDGGPNGGQTWLGTVIYYDENLRPVQIHAENYKAGVDIISMNYNFNGQVLRKKRSHLSQDVTWKDQTGLFILGNKIVRGTAAAGWTSGAASIQVLAAAQDGWLEFNATSTNMIRAIGLSDQNSNVNYTSIDYAFYLNNTGTVSIYEQAAGKFVTGNFGTYKPGDLFRIERKAGVIRYYRNNSLLRTSTYPSATVLMADVSLNTPSATLSGIRTSFSQNSLITEERWSYDHQGRILNAWHKMDQQPEVLMVSNQYDEQGRLKSKSLHTTSGKLLPKQKLDYRYNIRGWLESINDGLNLNDITNSEYPDLFAQEIYFEKSDPALLNAPLFNGAITAYKILQPSGSTIPVQSGFTLSYDPMGRLQVGIQSQFLTTGQWSRGANEERITSYDLNGNIRSLTRKESGVITDDLIYQYLNGSNQVNGIQDRSAEKFRSFVDGNSTTLADFNYDRNGNLVTDLNRGISTSAIQYNMLDLPEVINRGTSRVQYVYSAEGEKLVETTFYFPSTSMLTSGVRQREWCGTLEYDQDQIKSLEHEEGRIMMQDTETIFFEDGTNKAVYTVSGCTLNPTTINGEKYLAIQSTSTTARSGIQMIGGVISVSAGERYLIKVKGYRVSGTARSSNPVYISVKINGTDLSWPSAAIPASNISEHEVEQSVIVPVSGTMQIGLTWNTPVLTGEIFYLNQIEINRIATIVPEYQYYLKDHVDNIRATFTTQPKLDDRKATAESAMIAQERKKFLRFENVKLVNAAVFDFTNGTQSGTSIRLNGSTNERYGLACSLSVMPGDLIEAEVWAKYVDPNKNNWTAALSSLMSLVTSGSTTIVTDGASYSTSTSTFPFSYIQNSLGSSSSGPKAYLNWLVFDRKFNLIAEQSGYVQMSNVAREYGQDVGHEKLKAPTIRIKEAGYVYVYFSNESTTPIEVYFDDLKIAHQHSPLIQSIDYLPFGSTFNEQMRENEFTSSKKFNGMDQNTSVGLGWLWPIKYRTYDPLQSRFLQTDPVIKDHESVYAWNTNNPILFPDPMGADSVQRARALKEAERYVQNNPDPKGPGGYGFAGYQKGTPGNPIDCSGMISQCASVSGFGTLNNYVKGKPNNNGVRNILEQPLTREIPIQDIVEGNIIVFPNKTHVAFISDIVRDNQNQVTGFTLIHSERTNGPNRDVIDLNNANNFYVRKYLGVGASRASFYQWDTPDRPMTPRQNEINK